jgi:hypothetical protein
VVLEGSQEFLFFFCFYRIISQEFLRNRNSCGTGIPEFTPESGGFFQIPVPANCCLAKPATKEGSLLSKIWTKIDLFQPLARTGLDHGICCPLPLLAPPGLKVRAAVAAEAVMAEEAALMVEALVDVTLETKIATADADNIRQ